MDLRRSTLCDLCDSTSSQLHAAVDRDYEIELSVDETEQPTTLAEHYIVADQCLQGGMKLVSLAPRFVGDFEKGVDYKGPSDCAGEARCTTTRRSLRRWDPTS